MSESEPGTRLDAFLRTDPRDVGCEQAMEALHIYAELSPEERRLRMPGMEAHLRVCGPCEEDLKGLLMAISMAETEI